MSKKNTLEPTKIDTEEKKDLPKKPREKKAAYQGNRWSSLVVLIIMVVIGFVLSLTAHH